MDVRELYPSRFLAAFDLRGKTVTVEIDRLTLEEMFVPGEQEMTHKPVLWFAGKQKGLVLNKTNALAVASHHGPDTEAWQGRSVQLYPTQIRAFGKTHEVVRIK